LLVGQLRLTRITCNDTDCRRKGSAVPFLAASVS
jgi:hypothetical protein